MGFLNQVCAKGVFGALIRVLLHDQRTSLSHLPLYYPRDVKESVTKLLKQKEQKMISDAQWKE